MYVHMYVYTYMHVLIYIDMYVCMCVTVCVFACVQIQEVHFQIYILSFGRQVPGSIPGENPSTQINVDLSQ